MMSNDNDQWARNPGELAWAILPTCIVEQLSPTSTTCTGTANTNHTLTSSYYYWPVILYPSWSYAAKQSGLFHNSITKATKMNTSGNSSSDSSSSIYQKVSFIDVKTCVTVDQMSKNVVPKKVALGCTSVKGQSLRPKVAAYYLGFAGGIGGDNDNDNDIQFLGTHCSWSAVNVQNVKRYSIDNCLQFLQQYSSHSSNTIPTMKNKDDTFWSHLLLAMEEASIVSEQCDSYDPKVLIRQLNVYHEKNNLAITKDNGQHVEKNNNDKLRQQECNVNHQNNKNNDDDFASLESLTPEMWSDWRQGGQTQKTMESQSQFVLTAGTAM